MISNKTQYLCLATALIAFSACTRKSVKPWGPSSSVLGKTAANKPAGTGPSASGAPGGGANGAKSGAPVADPATMEGSWQYKASRCADNSPLSGSSKMNSTYQMIVAKDGFTTVEDDQINPGDSYYCQIESTYAITGSDESYGVLFAKETSESYPCYDKDTGEQLEGSDYKQPIQDAQEISVTENLSSSGDLEFSFGPDGTCGTQDTIQIYQKK